MAAKRFTLTYEKLGKYFSMGIVDHETKEPFDDTTYEFHQCSFKDSKDEMEDLCLLLNELHEENNELRLQLNLCSDQRNEFHRGARENANRVGKLEKENEQLKQLLDYADDLIPSHLSEHFIRQWRNFKTGHKEYNDFWEEKLKKHKELKENVK